MSDVTDGGRLEGASSEDRVRAGPRDKSTNEPVLGDLEHVGITIEVPTIKAQFVGQARQVFSKPMTAGISVFIVTLATVLLVAVAPPTVANAVVVGWLVICVGLLRLSAFGKG